MLLKLAKASLSVLAPTVMDEGADEGDMVQASAPRLLPAAVTTVMPAATIDSTASLRLAARGPTRDMLMMADLMLLRVLWSFTLWQAKTASKAGQEMLALELVLFMIVRYRMI